MTEPKDLIILLLLGIFNIGVAQTEEDRKRSVGMTVLMILIATALFASSVDAATKADVTTQVERAMGLLLQLEDGTPIDGGSDKTVDEEGTISWLTKLKTP